MSPSLSSRFLESEWGEEKKNAGKFGDLSNNVYFCQRKIEKREKDMGKIVGTKETIITTNEGLKLVRRVTTVLMPNGKYRYPVDYYDATPGPVKITKEELERVRIPVYKQLI